MVYSIKAAVLLAEDELALAKIVSYIIYSFDPETKTLMTQLVKEVQIILDETAGEHEGQTLVARQETDKEAAKMIADVDACLFLELMGEYNISGVLLDIREVGYDGTMGISEVRQDTPVE